MKYKIVFSDIDGTFLNAQHEVLASTDQAVKRLIRQGIPLVLVSARMPEAIYPITDRMGIRIPVISYSGALVVLADGTEIYSKTMQPAHTKAVLQEIVARWPSAVVNYYAGRHWYVRDTMDAMVQQEVRITGAQPEQAGFAALLAGGVLPNKLLCMCEPAVCAEMEHELGEAFPELNVVRSCDFLLEIMDTSISKAKGIEVLLQSMGLMRDEALAFGDNYNDVDMLRYVGMGVAMGNAPEPVKAAADDVTGANDADGIAAFLKKCGLEG